MDLGSIHPGPAGQKHYRMLATCMKEKTAHLTVAGRRERQGGARDKISFKGMSLATYVFLLSPNS